jgi:hypothetical protein
VGRILREKHNNPIIVDIIDSHEPFKNQWKKRKAFYKKENYQIIQISSNKYTSDIQMWKSIHYNNNNRVNKTKPISIISNSSNDKSIVDSDQDDDELDNNENKLLSGKCLLTL